MRMSTSTWPTLGSQIRTNKVIGLEGGGYERPLKLCGCSEGDVNGHTIVKKSIKEEIDLLGSRMGRGWLCSPFFTVSAALHLYRIPCYGTRSVIYLLFTSNARLGFGFGASNLHYNVRWRHVRVEYTKWCGLAKRYSRLDASESCWFF